MIDNNSNKPSDFDDKKDQGGIIGIEETRSSVDENISEKYYSSYSVLNEEGILERKNIYFLEEFNDFLRTNKSPEKWESFLKSANKEILRFVIRAYGIESLTEVEEKILRDKRVSHISCSFAKDENFIAVAKYCHIKTIEGLKELFENQRISLLFSEEMKMELLLSIAREDNLASCIKYCFVEKPEQGMENIKKLAKDIVPSFFLSRAREEDVRALFQRCVKKPEDILELVKDPKVFFGLCFKKNIDWKSEIEKADVQTIKDFKKLIKDKVECPKDFNVFFIKQLFRLTRWNIGLFKDFSKICINFFKEDKKEDKEEDKKEDRE